MPLFSDPRAKRRTACMVLLAFLFALASGVANACLLHERGTHWHGPSENGQLSAQAPQVSPGHAGIDDEHAENSGPGKSACLKVCGDNNQSVIKLASSVDLADVTMAPPMAPFWPAPLATAERDNTRQVLPAPRPGVPLRTRFARLAL